MSRIHACPLLTIACGFAVASGLVSMVSCTAILTPRDDVERCGSASDCPPTGDNRYVAECRFDPESDLSTDDAEQICVASFKTSIGCNPMNYMGEPDNPFFETFEELSDSTRYSCDMTPGVRGCPPEQGAGCMGNLEVGDEGFCVDPDEGPGNPTISLRGNSEFAGQDVLDQFCRSFFCDDSFVCDSTDFTCVKCDPEEPFGEGGCGTVVVAGEPSCVYTAAQTESVCDGPDADTNSPKFGDCSGS